MKTSEVKKGSITALCIFKPLDSVSDNSLHHYDCISNRRKSDVIIPRLQSDTLFSDFEKTEMRD